jgi:Sperm tail C-terminal domain
MRGYWHQLCHVVSDDSVEVWRQLERDSVGLKELLVKRAGGIAEVDDLARKNVELKRLLNQYLGDSTVNNFMMVPPAHVMKVRDVLVPPSANGVFNNNNSSSAFGVTGDKAARGEREKANRFQSNTFRNTKSAGALSMKRAGMLNGTR